MLVKATLIVLLTWGFLLAQGTVYVSNSQNYYHESQRGSSVSFSSLSDAVVSLRKPTPRFEEIQILPGYYVLNDKTGIVIQGLSLEISGSGTDKTVLDCQGSSNALVIIDAEISIHGLTIKNCASNMTSGGINIRTSNIVLEDVTLENNFGLIASGVSLEDSTAKIMASRFINNRGSSLVVTRSKLTLADVTFSTSAQQSTSDLICSTSHLDISSTSDSTSPLPRINSNECTFGFTSVPTKNVRSEKRSVEEVTAATCGNNACESGEDCFSCPKDCGCAFDGYKVEGGTGTLSSPISSSTFASLNPEFTSYMNGTTGDVFGKAFAYFIVEDSGDYTFQLSTKYMAGEVLIDGKTIISSKLIQSSLKASANIIVQSGYIHNISINFYSNGNYDRYLGLSWKDSDNKSDVYKLFDNVFYSVNICGDHIDDDNIMCPQDAKGNGCETYACLADDIPPRYTTVKLQNNATVAAMCASTSILSFIALVDCTNGTDGLLTQCTTTLSNSTKVSVNCIKVDASVCMSNSPLTCGTGICVERFAEDCFVDCYDHITTPCPSIAPPVGHISPGLPVRDDTFGNLIRNQMLWHLPGIEHVTYGFDIIKGEGATSPLFYFGYCSDTPLQTVQDTYRGNVYTVPAEVYAQPAPRCSFSMESSTYSSSVQMANEMTQNTVKNYNANAGGGFKLFGKKVGANAAVAYTQEKSVAQSRELETRQTGSLLTTEVKCSTSKVQVNSYTFHPGFLKDLAAVTDNTTMMALMKKYGTYFYDNVVLGGKLKQVTILDQNFESQRSRNELVQNAQKSFSGTVSAPMFSGSGGYDSSIDSSIDSDHQSKFESSSQRTTVITYGGPPGSFGPALSNAPTNFGDWARSVDKLPVPIEYELRPISDIISNAWHINYYNCSTSVLDVWKKVEPDYYDSLPSYEQKTKLNRYTLYWFWDTERFNSTYLSTINSSTPFFVALSNDITDFKLAPKRDENNDFVQIFDQNGPPGTVSPIWFYFSGNKTANPIVFDFYSPVQLDVTSPSVSVRLYSPTRSVSFYYQYGASCSGYYIIPGRNYYREMDATLFSTIYVHDWKNGFLHSAHPTSGPDVPLGGQEPPSHTCNTVNYPLAYVPYLRNYTWVSEDFDPVGKHIIFFKMARVNGASTPNTLRVTLIGDYGLYTFVNTSFSTPSITVGDQILAFLPQVIQPGIGPIREVRLNIGASRSSTTLANNCFSISNLWVSAPFCGNSKNNTNFACDLSNPRNRKVFSIPSGDSIPNLCDFNVTPLEIALRPLSDFNI